LKARACRNEADADRVIKSVLPGSDMQSRIGQWWTNTYDQRQEAELAAALAVQLAAGATVSLRLLFEAL
jgi:aminopeptidase-like protein